MTKRERVKAAVEFRRVDRIPLSDSFWEDTLLRWYGEGLPAGSTPRDHFDFDIFTMSVDPSPGFEAEVLDEDDRFVTLRDRFGYVAKKQKGVSRTLEYLSYPAADREGWQQVKSMFELAQNELDKQDVTKIDDESFPFRVTPVPTWEGAKAKCKAARDGDYYILASAYGPHEAVWRLHGFTETLMDLALRPDLITEIAGTYVTYLVSVLEECKKRGFEYDGFMMVEDVAATRGMLFSPETWRGVYRPWIKQVGEYLRGNGIHFWMHGCGNAKAIYEDLIDCGLQVYNPLEAKSGLDVVELSREYKGRLAFCGNIDATKMAAAQDVIENEIRRKLGAVGCEGGYIYHSDHSVPPEVSFNRYEFIIDQLRKHGCSGEG